MAEQEARSETGETEDCSCGEPPQSVVVSSSTAAAAEQESSMAEGGGGDPPVDKRPASPAPAKTKVDILLKAAGSAPIMKQKKWAVDPDKKIGSVIQFIRKCLKLDPSESLFLYVNQSFAPAPDQIVRNLYECFGTDGKLILHYCKTQAWG